MYNHLYDLLGQKKRGHSKAQ